MRYSSAFVALVAPLLVSAAPARFFGKRGDTDVLVFKFADVLEQLESAFYSQALAKFQESDFTSAGFASTQIPVQQFQNIQSDEATHSSVIQSTLKALGQEPITSCKFDFSSALTDVPTMAATARVVENVGVGAYIGGALLLTDPRLLSAAASILTVEARHQTILNVLSSSGTAIPAPFDMAFTPSEVLAMAAPFFSGPCDVGIPANPTLAVTNTGTVAPGTKLTFSSAAINGSVPEDGMFCQMMLGGNTMSITLPYSNCVVPDGVNGPVAIYITSDNQALLNDVKDRSPAKTIAGPTLTFIDTQPEMLGQMARSGSANAGANQSATTQTISPQEASSLVASASATATATASGTDASAAASATATVSGSAASSSSTDSPTVNTSAASSGTPGGPNTFTGKSPDGAVTVNGWNKTN